MLDSNAITVLPRPERLWQLDVLVPAGKRRKFTPEAKAQIVAESFVSKDSVCAVARRHHLSASQLFAWRRTARRGHDASTGAISSVPDPSDGEPRAEQPDRLPAEIEIAIGCAVVRVPHGADPATLKLVLDALREARGVQPSPASCEQHPDQPVP